MTTSGPDWFSQLEPGACHGIDPHHAMLVSIAISMKRIADRLSDGPKGQGKPDDEAQRGEGERRDTLNETTSAVRGGEKTNA